MGVTTEISWCDHTHNPWRGCAKVSPGCANCYAEVQSRRNPAVLGEWGPDARRVIASESYWKQPLAWDRAAAKAGERRRVFCGSMMDVFEDRPELDESRFRLLRLIASTDYLNWLLLTKRPENVEPLLKRLPSPLPGFSGWDDWCQEITDRVWLGVTVEDQTRANERIPVLLSIPARVRFLSVEPMLGPINLATVGLAGDGPAMDWYSEPIHPGIHWVIVGGESGSKARPFDVAWARSLRDQCQAAGVPFFMKQDAGPRSGQQGRIPDDLWAVKQFPES